MKRIFLVMATACGLVGAKEKTSKEVIVDFLEYHCYDCHDDASKKGEREFESFKLPLESVQDLITAQEIIDQVRDGTYKPELSLLEEEYMSKALNVQAQSSQ